MWTLHPLGGAFVYIFPYSGRVVALVSFVDMDTQRGKYGHTAAAVGVHVVHIRAALRLSASLFCCRYRHAGRAKHHTGGAVVPFRMLSVLSTLSISGGAFMV